MSNSTASPLPQLTVFEFLDFELYFEIAQYMKCDISDLNQIKDNDPDKFKRAASHVLRNVVTQACADYVIEKGTQKRKDRDAEAKSSMQASPS